MDWKSWKSFSLGNNTGVRGVREVGGVVLLARAALPAQMGQHTSLFFWITSYRGPRLTYQLTLSVDFRL